MVKNTYSICANIPILWTHYKYTERRIDDLIKQLSTQSCNYPMTPSEIYDFVEQHFRGKLDRFNNQNVIIRVNPFFYLQKQSDIPKSSMQFYLQCRHGILYLVQLRIGLGTGSQIRLLPISEPPKKSNRAKKVPPK